MITLRIRWRARCPDNVDPECTWTLGPDPSIGGEGRLLILGGFTNTGSERENTKREQIH